MMPTTRARATCRQPGAIVIYILVVRRALSSVSLAAATRP